MLSDIKILRRDGKNTQKNYTKKDLHDPDNHEGMITHLKPGILDCEVKWALGSTAANKDSGGDGIPAELFQILKDDAIKKTAFNMSANLENPAVATGLEKVSFYSNPKKGNAKKFPNYHTIALILHASKIMFKILQARLQQYVNWEFPGVHTGFRKGRGARDQIDILWIIGKARKFQKNIYFCFIDYTKDFDYVVVAVQTLSHVWPFETPWTAAQSDFAVL